MTNEPETPSRGEEAAAEAMLYAQVYNEQSRMLISPPECRTRARAAMEDFRDSRVTAQVRNQRETRQ